MGAKVSFWTTGLLAVEEVFDRWRGAKDFFNTVAASLAMAGGFSLWSEGPLRKERFELTMICR